MIHDTLSDVMTNNNIAPVKLTTCKPPFHTFKIIIIIVINTSPDVTYSYVYIWGTFRKYDLLL